MATDNVKPILCAIKASLPENESLKTPYEAIAILCHATMAVNGFRLVGFSEDDKFESESHESSLAENWRQASRTDNFSFRYAHSLLSSEYLVKISRLGAKTFIFALLLGDDQTRQLDVATSAFIRPWTGELSKMEDAYISETRITEFVELFTRAIIEPILERGHKIIGGNAGTINFRGPAVREVPSGQVREDFKYPDFAPPGFEDEHHMGGVFRDPLSIGTDDAGPNLSGPRFGGGRFGAYGSGPAVGEGGFRGMHPTIDSPLFGERPIGARYDPVGPGDVRRGGLRQPGVNPPGTRDMFM